MSPMKQTILKKIMPFIRDEIDPETVTVLTLVGNPTGLRIRSKANGRYLPGLWLPTDRMFESPIEASMYAESIGLVPVEAAVVDFVC